MDYIFITNDERTAKYAEESGVHRIMVDLEIIGKKERQGHLNTVISEHTIEDVKSIRRVINNSKLLVRVNPIHSNSKKEINQVINAGADVLMLPMFKSEREVYDFVNYVDGRCKVMLLLETSQALARIDDILKVKGIDEIHIGLNDLHLSMGLDFMFELLSGGIVEYLSEKIRAKGVRFGFGGIARLGQGKLDSSLILSEHFRLGSDIVILSRDFQAYTNSYDELKSTIDLKLEINKVSEFFESLKNSSESESNIRRKQLVDLVQSIITKE
jgi:2-keto-3-deoxy-L-rhamnonate aldolase RhmA